MVDPCKNYSLILQNQPYDGRVNKFFMQYKAIQLRVVVVKNKWMLKKITKCWSVLEHWHNSELFIGDCTCRWHGLTLNKTIKCYKADVTLSDISEEFLNTYSSCW